MSLHRVCAAPAVVSPSLLVVDTSYSNTGPSSSSHPEDVARRVRDLMLGGRLPGPPVADGVLELLQRIARGEPTRDAQILRELGMAGAPAEGRRQRSPALRALLREGVRALQHSGESVQSFLGVVLEMRLHRHFPNLVGDITAMVHGCADRGAPILPVLNLARSTIQSDNTMFVKQSELFVLEGLAPEQSSLLAQPRVLSALAQLHVGADHARRIGVALERGGEWIPGTPFTLPLLARALRPLSAPSATERERVIDCACHVFEVYQARGWPVGRVIEKLCQSTANRRETNRAPFLNTVDCFLAHGWRVDLLVEPPKDPMVEQLFELHPGMATQLERHGIRASGLSVELLRSAVHSLRLPRWVAGRGAVVAASELQGRGISSDEIIRLQRDLAAALKQVAENQLPVEKRHFDHLEQAIRQPRLPTSKEIDFLARSIQVQAIIESFIWSGDAVQHEHATAKLRQLADNDPPPHEITDANGAVTPEADAFFRETLQVYNDALEEFYGFSALTHTARRYGAPVPGLAQFGLDSGATVELIHAADTEGFPGVGWAMTGLRRDRLFAPDAKQHPDGPPSYDEILESLPWARDVFPDFEETTFIKLRGCVVRIPPPRGRYLVLGVPYAYLVYNHHYQNPWCEVAFGVPVQVIREKLAGCMVSIDGALQADVSSVADINTRGFHAADLAAASARLGLPILNLGWGSNLGGGLCNAFPTDSSPFYDWEVAARANRETQDMWGHIHKTHMWARGYEPNYSPKHARDFERFRDAHRIVYEFARGGQLLGHLFRVGELLYWKGHTLAGELERWELGASSVSEGSMEENSISPHADRMLKLAYRAHSDCLRRGAPRSAFPLVCVVDALSFARPPHRVVLDTYSMKVHSRRMDRWFPLPKEGPTEQAQLLWREHVMRDVGQNQGLIPLDREIVGPTW